MRYFENVTTEEARAALPIGVHVLDATGDGMTKYGDQDWAMHQTAFMRYPDHYIKLPIKVLSYPSAETITITRAHYDELALRAGRLTSQGLVDYGIGTVTHF